MIFIATTDIITVRRGKWKATTMITGPNDARRVVWALGKFFFLFFVCVIANYYK